MTIVLTLASLISLFGLPLFGGSTDLSSRTDSIPVPQRYPFKLASASSPNQERWSTLVSYPTKARLRTEISLPLGFNPTTVRISLGDRVLTVNEDYVFIPNANRIRVLDEEALTSDQPIKIIYEGVATPVSERLRLRYKP